MNNLERRYRRVLWLYPAEYRRERGAELLATLLDSAEAGRQRPSLRETSSLVLGGLRMRAGRDQRQSQRETWLAAARAGALMLLVYGTASAAARIAFDAAHQILTKSDALILVAPTLGLGAVIATALNHYRSAGLTAALTFALALPLSLPTGIEYFTDFWSFPLAVALLVPLARFRPGATPGLLKYAFAAPIFLVIVDYILSPALPAISGIVERGAAPALCVAGLLWMIVDERVAIAIGLLLINDALTQGTVAAFFLIFRAGAISPSTEALWLAFLTPGPALLLSIAAIAARRQARL